MDDQPRALSARQCDLTELHNGLRELVGARVGVEVSPFNGSGPFLTAIGQLGGVCAVGRGAWGGIAFDVGDATFRITARAFAGAWREEYADRESLLRWRLVAVELRFGVVIEVEEIPSGHDAR